MKFLTAIFLSLFLTTAYAQEPAKKEGTVVNGMRLAKKKQDKPKADNTAKKQDTEKKVKK